MTTMTTEVTTEEIKRVLAALRARPRRKVTITCARPECGQVFQAECGRGRKYCTVYCGTRHWRERHGWTTKTGKTIP